MASIKYALERARYASWWTLAPVFFVLIYAVWLVACAIRGELDDETVALGFLISLGMSMSIACNFVLMRHRW